MICIYINIHRYDIYIYIDSHRYTIVVTFFSQLMEVEFTPWHPKAVNPPCQLWWCVPTSKPWSIPIRGLSGGDCVVHICTWYASDMYDNNIYIHMHMYTVYIYVYILYIYIHGITKSGWTGFIILPQVRGRPPSTPCRLNVVPGRWTRWPWGFTQPWGYHWRYRIGIYPLVI